MKHSWEEMYPLYSAHFTLIILVNPSNKTKEVYICQTDPCINNMVYVTLSYVVFRVCLCVFTSVVRISFSYVRITD